MNKKIQFKSYGHLFFGVMLIVFIFFTFNHNIYATSDSWETENNDSKETADYISVNETYHGTSKSHSDRDYYKISVTKPGVLQLNFQYEGTNIWLVGVYDEEGNYITGTEGGEGNANSKSEKVGIAEGSYYIDVYCYYRGESSGIEYTFSCSFFESSSWEQEVNDDPDTALRLSLGKTIHGTIGDSFDEDYYYFTIPKDGDVSVKFSHDKTINKNDCWYWVISDGVNTARGFETLTVNGQDNNTVIKTFLKKGTYYICISSCYYMAELEFDDYWSDAKYNLRVSMPVTSAPKKTKVALYGYNDVKFSWSKVNNASGYRVYYKPVRSSKWIKIGNTQKNYVKKKNLKSGTKYEFKVVPYKIYSGKLYDGLSKKSNSIYTLKKLSTPKVYRSGSKVKVKWSNINGETGYQISKSTSKKKTNIAATYKSTSKSSALIKAKKGKTYYYKVRAYKNVWNGEKYVKVYGPWSNVKSYKRR